MSVPCRSLLVYQYTTAKELNLFLLTNRQFKRGFAPLLKISPLPLDKGKGIKGMGLIKPQGGGLPYKRLKVV